MQCPFCDCDHCPEGDRYGCPNCHGEGLESDAANCLRKKSWCYIYRVKNWLEMANILDSEMAVAQ